ncbi:hypothetical protein LAZ67_3000854 [Cordylochernes scorpioides]|uniref:Integrase zinc-binding domain-containing protein n=1 Tax=Cordylochernes scorpioides TaxID=51811 RepID=A0ABY6KB51_9ARAC|nr:hypothetical protein LAZ67_3000854 [Cordylochernes scorpioides]
MGCRSLSSTEGELLKYVRTPYFRKKRAISTLVSEYERTQRASGYKPRANPSSPSLNSPRRCPSVEEALQPLSGKSPLLKLNPFLDKGGLLRVGGRLNNTFLRSDQNHPIILSKAHYITQLVTRQYHDRLLHAGVQLTLSAIRGKYWIPSGRCLVKQTLFKCIKCARFRTMPVQQLMDNLPTSQINWTRPFTKTGIDFAGPVIVKTLNEKFKM